MPSDTVQESRQRRMRLSWILATLTSLAYIPLAVTRLGFVRDDWAHYVAMRSLHETSSWGDALAALASNSWFGAHELRIFFGSFVVHYLIAPLGDAASAVSYLWLSGLHVGAALLAGWIVWRLTQSQVIGVTTLIVLTYFPAVTQPAMWVNNLFFVQPWFFLLLTAALAVALRDRGIFGSIALLPSALVCAFSGESALPLLLGLLAALPLVTWLRTKQVHRVVGAAIPFFGVVVALVTYLLAIVKWPNGSDADLSRLSAFGDYLVAAQSQFLSLSDVTSSRFGSGSVAASTESLLIGGALAALSSVAILLACSSPLAPTARRRWLVVIAVLIGMILAVVPWALGVVTGARPGPDLRYLYLPAAFFLVLLLLLLDAFSSINRPSPRIIGRILMVAVAAYSAIASSFNIVDIWGVQRVVDERIWSEINAFLNSETSAIVTFHPEHPYLMAPYHSNAVSDFQADWGISGRIAWEHPDWDRIPVFRDASPVASGEISVRHYYDDTTSCVPVDVASGGPTVIYLTFDYGTTLATLRDSALLVTSDGSAFQQSRKDLLADSSAMPSSAPWYPCSPLNR